jgi:AcrR family transcriptional regulator
MSKPGGSKPGKGRPKPVGAPTDGRELRARGKRTMQLLLDAGVQVFEKRGFHAARVDDIVKVAKTSHGTFYLYFSNKEDLFRALAEDVAAQTRLLADELPAIEPDGDGYDALRAWLGRFAEVYAHYGPVIRAWTEAETGSSDFGRMGTDVLGDLTRAFVVKLRKTCPDDVDPTIAGIALVAMIERCNYYVVADQVRVDREAMLDTLASVMHAGLFGSTDTRRKTA